MSYKPRSLFTLIEDVNRSIFLPHIQRPFVWEREQMARLFDSLMRSYPIQTFLFWRTKEFIKARRFMASVEWDPDLSDYYDEERSLSGVEKVFVLDGRPNVRRVEVGIPQSSKLPAAPFRRRLRHSRRIRYRCELGRTAAGRSTRGTRLPVYSPRLLAGVCVHG